MKKNRSFLYLEEGSEEVKIYQEAMSLPSIKELYNSDKRPGEIEKPFFKRCLKYIYHVYYNDHPVLKSLGPLERKQKVAEMYFEDARVNVSDFEKNAKVLEVIKDYNYYQDTVSGKSYRNILKKLDEIKDYIENIPLTKVITIKDHPVHVKVPGEDGKLVEQEFFINTKVSIDNAKEVMDSMKIYESLLDTEERLMKRINQEQQESDISEKTMLESGEL